MDRCYQFRLKYPVGRALLVAAKLLAFKGALERDLDDVSMRWSSKLDRPSFLL